MSLPNPPPRQIPNIENQELKEFLRELAESVRTIHHWIIEEENGP